MSGFIALLRKELLDARRDRRSLMAALSYAFGAPITMCLLFTFFIHQLTAEEELQINIIHAHYAPDLINHLASQGILAKEEAKEEVKQASSAKSVAIELEISKDYASHLSKGIPAEVYLRADYSDEKLTGDIRKVSNALSSYNQEMATLRLIARGVHPQLLQPLSVQVQDQAEAVAKGGMILGLALFTMIYAVFISGMNLAIDTSAGERERNSLALLLSHPISIAQIIWSKIAAVMVFAMGGLALSLLVSKFAYAFVPWEEWGFAIELSPSFIGLMLLTCLPIALLAACLLIFVSFMAKSFKEAQSYLTLALLLPMGLSMMSAYRIAPEQLQWLPISGQHQALMSFVKAQGLPWLQLLVSSGLTIGLSLLLVLGLTQMLKSEKTVFAL